MPSGTPTSGRHEVCAGKAWNKQFEDLNHLIAASEILQHRSGDDVLSKLGHHQ